ncbi:MAG: heavy metal translocating P-type ATPase [Phycisphaerae bacterium]|nr:heavy metal translocating P-type ATPase [Phycisphaerae bacterium]
MTVVAEIDCECAHCGLPVAADDVDSSAVEQFCCGGCRAVWTSLHSCGLEQYYELKAREAAVRDDRRPANVTQRRFAHLERPEFVAKHVRIASDGRLSTELCVDGLHCGACVWLLEALPRLVEGLLSVRVDIGRAVALIEWEQGRVTLGEIARRFDQLGYQLLPMLDPAARENDRAIDRAWLIRLGIAAALTSNSMAVAFALYGGLFATMATPYRVFFQWASVALAIGALVGPGRIYFVNALAAIRTRTPHMDIPVALGLFAATGSGLVNTLRGTGTIYCESATALVFLLLVGRFIQYRQQRKARQDVELITTLVPAIARRRSTDGAIEEVPIEALMRGDLVEVLVGETVPCDGVLVSGVVHFDVAILTGESKPALTNAGESVWAGTRSLDQPATVVVEVSGEATRAGRLLALVADASRRRPPIVELANRMAGWFLLAVLAGSGFTAWWWWHLGSDVAIARAVALLVVTCPCALGLATPLAIASALGKAARAGVLVKGGDVLERLAMPGTIVLDKTGTLTQGRMTVTSSEGDATAFALAGALEQSSCHPIATAISRAFAPRNSTAASTSRVHERAGYGIEGEVDGQAVALGNHAFVTERYGEAPRWAKTFASSAMARAETPVYVGVDGALRGVISVGDPIRSEAQSIVAQVRSLGWNVVMCSGDQLTVARAVGRAVGLGNDEIEAGCDPERKLAFMRDRAHASPVVMVGDGVNDLAAMAAADVGVAVRNGAQSALHVADVCLAAGGLRPLVKLLSGAQRTMRAIRITLAVSIAYNATGGVLAFNGLVNPLVAAVLMPVSSLTVLWLALWLPKFDPVRRAEEVVP